MSWFSRAQAMNAKNNANTAILKSALTNYINATKNMNANATRKALNNTRIGLTETYKNRIANSVANAVIAAKKAKVAMAAANAGAVSETAAATHVNNAALKIKALNELVESVSKNLNNKKLTANKAQNYINHIKAAANAQKVNIKNGNNVSTLIRRLEALRNSTQGVRITPGANNAAAQTPRANNNTVAGFNALPGNNAVAISKTKTKRLNNMVNENMTGNMFKQANNAASKFNQNLKNELSKTTNNKLKSNITNNAQANALATRVRNAARAAGKNENKNVKNALARINAHKNSLTKKN